LWFVNWRFDLSLPTIKVNYPGHFGFFGPGFKFHLGRAYVIETDTFETGVIVRLGRWTWKRTHYNPLRLRASA